MKKIIFIWIQSLFISSTVFATSLIEVDGNGNNWIINRVNTSTDAKTQLGSGTCGGGGVQPSISFVDNYTNEVFISCGDNSYNKFDLTTNAEVSVSINASDSSAQIFTSSWNGESIISSGTDSEDSSTTTILGSLDIKDSSGNTLIENKADGSTHIGENSLVTQEVNGRQELYATNSSGNQIDINIKSGTNLLIDGVNILDSIGADISGSSAMSAALAALPNASPDAAYTCGIGTGLHDSSSALAAGCAADFANFTFVDNMPSIFERASFNIGSSFLMNGEPDLSEARDTSIKAGITFKFGAPKKFRTADITQLRTENKIDAVMLQNKKVMNENAILKKQLANNNEKNQLLEDQIAAINLKLETLNMVTSN
jgi:hypothetical protein